MNTIKEHIKKGSFKQIYLLYGSENYLKKLYRDKLKRALVAEDDSMNYSYFEGKTADALEITRIAETMPFFADRRLIVIENSGWFKSGGDFADYLREMPETTFIIFVENEADKRNKLYKTVKDIGYVSEMNGMDESNLLLFAGQLFKRDNKSITANDLRMFIEETGQNMENICNEAEKLICYCADKEVITAQDISEVCTQTVTGRMFVMIDAIATGNSKAAIRLYFDLLALKEKPMSILYLVIRHFNILYILKELKDENADRKSMAETAGIPPFSVGKYLSQVSNFTADELKNILNEALKTEQSIKTGEVSEQIAVELLIAKAASGI